MKCSSRIAFVALTLAVVVLSVALLVLATLSLELSRANEGLRKENITYLQLLNHPEIRRILY